MIFKVAAKYYNIIIEDIKGKRSKTMVQPRRHVSFNELTGKLLQNWSDLVETIQPFFMLMKNQLRSKRVVKRLKSLTMKLKDCFISSRG